MLFLNKSADTELAFGFGGWWPAVGSEPLAVDGLMGPSAQQNESGQTKR